jgi:hypothetical protein
MTDHTDILADIKQKGYPCSSSEFWWLVDRVAELEVAIATTVEWWDREAYPPGHQWPLALARLRELSHRLILPTKTKAGYSANCSCGFTYGPVSDKERAARAWGKHRWDAAIEQATP